ncbi:MAG TPA: hypothetical protein EYF98_11535 [Planctomycetes bacterium]|nr:hypothetical protein [Planctomycetota bacterium]
MSDVLARLRRVQGILESLRERDAEFSERLIRHEYETAQEHVLLTKRIDALEARMVAATPESPPNTPSLFAELAGNRYGRFLLVSLGVALLAWAGVPIKKWTASLPLPEIHETIGSDDAAEGSLPLEAEEP